MASVSETVENEGALSVTAALCVDREAFDRFGRVLRRLLVGLVDQTINLRLLSCDPRAERLTLGPVQTIVHKRPVWPMTRRRIEPLLHALSGQPPTVVHAMSSASYGVAGAVADAFDADLVLQVTSLTDCDTIARAWTKRAARMVSFTQPLKRVLQERHRIPDDRVVLIRPGVLTAQRPACFADPRRIPTVLCLSPLERGSGVDRLIEAVHVLRKREHQLMLFLLGRGRLEPTLRRIIRERRLSTCVTLAHPAGDPAHAMQHADIFVRPSTDNAFSDDILQAMAAGVAVVTAAPPGQLAGAISDFVIHDETAVIYEKPKAAALADAIEKLLVDRAQAQRIAAAGLEHVRAHHAVSAMAQSTADLYRKFALARATFSLKE
jgi:glycosyltransferase involved in cell wall biosynthesis